MKESVQKFDLEAAFKALDEVEIPVVKGIRPNRENLQEKFTKKLTSEVLVEDYFDVGDAGELEQASEEREAEIAKAKLARIEKIVDLDADSEEDLLPSYVGKLIMQCPQCMTLFYKNEEDIEKSEENPDVVNLNEPCQHCGNTSGYTLVGKVDTVGEEEASEYDVEDFDENELDLNFDEEEPVEEEDVEESTEEAATEEEEELDLEPIEDEEGEEEEEVKESLNEATIYITKAEMAKLDKEVEDAQKEVAKYKIPMKRNSAGESEPDFEAVPENQREAAKAAHDRYQKALKARPSRSQNIIKYTDESLTEDVEINKQMDLYNEFVKYLQKMVEQDEDALEEAKKLGNKEVIAAIEKRLENSKAELKAALPATVKDEVSAEELPTPEEAEMEAPAENKEDKKEKKESLTESLRTWTCWYEGHDIGTVEAETEEKAQEEMMAKYPEYQYNNTDWGVSLEGEEFDEALLNLNLDARGQSVGIAGGTGGAMGGVTNESKGDLNEFIGPAITSIAGASVANNLINNAFESLKESTDLLADDGTLAMLINPSRWSAKVRKEKLLADPDFVKALEAFAAEHDMIAKPGDLEDGVSPVEDMYICAFEGITGKALEDTLDELISYYVDIRAGGELTEAAPQAQGEFVSKLKRNYSATEIMVKELKSHPFFSRLSTRTIQRVLLPYYIDRMGRKDLSTQSMIDFFTEEGFAPFVLDHFFTMDPLARKELLKADAKFMEIFNAYASEFKLFPGSKDDLVPGENEFDYAFSIAFDFGDENEAQDTEIARDTIKSFAKMYAAGKFDKSLVEELKEDVAGDLDTLLDSEEFKKPISEKEVEAIKSKYEALEEEIAPGIESEIAMKQIVDTWESVEDLDDESFNKLTESYLTEVYSNVKSFEATGCDLKEGKLVVEGNITFTSGKVKPTTFVYEAKESADKKVVLEGLNADFATEKAFVLNCNLDKANCLIVESLNYKYSINETLVEGLVK